MYCIICKDKPDHLHVRMENRPAHVEYVLSSDLVSTAGPFTAEDKETMIGTLIVLNTQDLATAQDWATNDPYAKAGLFDSVEVLPWKHLIGGLQDPNKA
ncbi:YciI family protein [Alphaproteobacteria bacterium]|nr:YciI family protein [Alphaproteobacteria bacterium]MDC0148460.1 YciI family protein [Alphaproteobacteria bacterium]